MKIAYNENPMMTTVELDEQETEVLWLKVKIDQLSWRIHGAHFYLTEREKYNHFDLDRARQECDPDYLYNDEGGKENSKIDQRVDMITEEYIDCLKQSHCGDCTCVAMSCDKCSAEVLLGIHTTKGLGSHQAVKIHSAFGEYMKPWKRKRNIHEVVEYLENYDAAEDPPDWEGWEHHADRWNAEAKDAYNWLKNYRDKHFPVDPA